MWQDVGIIATFIIGVWNIVNNYRMSRRTTFINTVTAERVKWIGKIREDISTFVGMIQYFTYSIVPENREKTDQAQEIVRKIDALRYLIKLQLNPNDNRELIKLIDEIPNLTHHPDLFNTVQTAIDRLVICSQSLLKNEWEKVKEEAQRGDLHQSRLGRLKQSMFLALAILTYASCVEAQTYLCIADKATGFRFDKSTKTWVTAQFDVSDDKYVLTQKDDEWTWTKVGTEFVDCRQKQGFNSTGAFGCEFGTYSTLLMNRNTLRFQITAPWLFVGPFGEESVEGANTPYIEIGRCAVVK